MRNRKFFLEVEMHEKGTFFAKHYPRCDGCGGDFEDGDLFIKYINSCCGGGCSRNLCEFCIKESFNLLEKGKGNGSHKI